MRGHWLLCASRRITQSVNSLQQGLQSPVVWTGTFLNLSDVQKQAASGLSVTCAICERVKAMCSASSTNNKHFTYAEDIVAD